MKRTSFILALVAVTAIIVSSCSSIRSGAGGTDTSSRIRNSHRSDNSYDLIPIGDRITYTIAINTPEGQQMLKGLSLAEAKQLAEVEATRKYNCDRLIDPRFDYLKKGKRILRITVDGRPGIYKTREVHYDSNTRQEIDLNIRR